MLTKPQPATTPMGHQNNSSFDTLTAHGEAKDMGHCQWPNPLSHLTLCFTMYGQWR